MPKQSDTLGDMPEQARLLVWIDQPHRDLAIEVVRRSGMKALVVGSADPVASGELAATLASEREDDLRVAVQRPDLDAVLLATTDDSIADLRILRQSGLRILSIEPRPGSMAELMDDHEDADAASFAPLLRRSVGFRAATDVLPNFGEPRCVSIFFRCGKDQGSLFARLFDAMDIVQAICGQPEQIDAALASPVPGLPGVPEIVRGLRGSLTMNMRFPQNRCACVAASDQAGSWFRGVTVLGEGGCLRIHDDGFEWVDADGSKVDSFLGRQPMDYADLVADQLVRLVERRDLSDPPIDSGRLLALCESARVSCLTGQSETPRKMLEMLSRV
jgi:hypothetical protein